MMTAGQLSHLLAQILAAEDEAQITDALLREADAFAALSPRERERAIDRITDAVQERRGPFYHFPVGAAAHPDGATSPPRATSTRTAHMTAHASQAQRMAKARPRTSEQVVADQKDQAAREKAAREKAAPAAVEKKPATDVVPAIPTATAVAIPDNRTPLDAYLDEVAPAMMVGRMVKFSVTRDDGKAIADDIDFVALCDQTLVGWVKFNGEGEPPTRHMGLLFDRFALPPRDTLGDDDQTQWETGLDGKPADPWQHHMYLVLQRGDTGELFTFVTSSQTGRRAVGTLLRHYKRMRLTSPDQYPVVRLKTAGFQHSDDRVGWVATPALTVVGRAAKDSVAKPDTSVAADLNDQIPFL
jgi:hypothetical protein